MKTTTKPCRGMTFEDFLFLLPQFEWEQDKITQWVRDPDGACPVCAVNRAVNGGDREKNFWIDAADELGLSRGVARRVAHAADNHKLGDGRDIALLREYCGR